MQQLQTHQKFIQRTFELAVSSGKKGNFSFGALLVHNGEIIAEAENTQQTGTGYGHAEYNLVWDSVARFPDSVLAKSEIYASTKPCPRCTTSILAAGIPVCVFGVSETAFSRLLPFAHTPPKWEELIPQMQLQLRWGPPNLP